MNKNISPVGSTSKPDALFIARILPSVDVVLAFLLMLTISIPAFLIKGQPLKPVFYALFILPTMLAIITGRLNLFKLFKQTPVAFALIIPLLYWSLSVLWSESPDQINSFLRRTLSLSVFILGVAFVASSNKINLYRYLDIALFIVALGAIMQFVYFYLYLGKTPAWGRLGLLSTFGGPIHAAHYFGFFFFYGVVRFIETRGKIKVAYFLALLACIAYIFMANSRGPFVAIICVGLLMFFLKIRNTKWLLIFCVLAAGFIYFSLDFWVQRGLSHRPEIWLGAIDIISNNFFFGIGYNENLALNYGENYLAVHAHNLYLDIFVRTGVIGFTFLVMMLGFVCRKAINWDKSSLPFIAALMFFYVGMLTDVQKLLNSPTEVYIMFWLPLTILIAQNKSGHASINY